MNTFNNVIGDSDLESEMTEIGEQIIDLLSLRVKDNGRVDTAVGDKTPLGLALTIAAIIGGE